MDLDELRASRAAVVTVAQTASVFGVDVRTVTRASRTANCLWSVSVVECWFPGCRCWLRWVSKDEDGLTGDHGAGTGDR